MERSLKAALPAVDTGVVEAAGEKAKRVVVFVEFLNDRRRFKEVG